MKRGSRRLGDAATVARVASVGAGVGLTDAPVRAIHTAISPGPRLAHAKYGIAVNGCVASLGACFALVAQLFNLFLGQMLDADEHVLERADTDQLVELHLNRGIVAVLRVLDQENHQKRDDRRFTC